MNIYLVEADQSQFFVNIDSFVCVAESEEDARRTYPNEDCSVDLDLNDGSWQWLRGIDEEIVDSMDNMWVDCKDVDKLKVTLKGKAVNGLLAGPFHVSYSE